MKGVEKGLTRETQGGRKDLRQGRSGDKKVEGRCSCLSVQGSVHVSGCRTGRGPSGAGSWDRAFVWRPHLRTHNNKTMAVSFKTHSCSVCILFTVVHSSSVNIHGMKSFYYSVVL